MEKIDKTLVAEERSSKTAFDALATAYSHSYGSKKPILLKQIDKVLDDYLSFTELKEPTIITEHYGEEDTCGTTE